MIRRGAVREYVNGSLWVWPGISALAALLVGFVVSQIDVTPGSPLAPWRSRAPRTTPGRC